MAYELPKLPYAANALEPHIDALTMDVRTLKLAKDLACSVCRTRHTALNHS